MSGSSGQANAIYQQPWWLDAVAPGRWGEAAVRRGDQLVARLPYVLRKRFGLTLLTMPPFTQTLGPWYRLSEAKYLNQLAEQKEYAAELIGQLPPYDLFTQNFAPSVTNLLPFYWAGFATSVRYTYRLDSLQDLERLWWGLRENIRREIRKAQKQVVVRDDLSLDCFIDIAKKTFARQGLEHPYSIDTIRRLDEACVQHNARKMLFAQDNDARIHAALYIVWDGGVVNYLMGGGDPDLRQSGAASLLMWNAIEFASKIAECFDFEGSMIESVERFFRAFGARQVPYYRIARQSRRMRFLMAGRDVVSSIFGSRDRATALGGDS